MEISIMLGTVAIIVGCLALIIGLRTLYYARRLNLKWYKILILLGSVGSIATFLLLQFFGTEYNSTALLVQQIFAQLSLAGLHWLIAKDALKINIDTKLIKTITDRIDKILNSDK